MTVANVFASSGDGLVRNNGSSSWATLRNAASGTVASQYSPMNLAYNDGTTADKYIDRGFLSFDLSALPVNAVIDSVVIQPYITAKESGAGGSLCLVAGSQASTSTLATSDFSLCGSTEFMSRVTFASLTTSAYASWSLNAAGIAHVQAAVGGTAKFCFRGSFDLDNSAPGTSVYSLASAYASERTGTSEDPVLSITYHVAFGALDALTWSDGGEPSGAGGGTTVNRLRAAADSLTWTDGGAGYRRSTTEVLVRGEGANTTLGGSEFFDIDLTGATTIGEGTTDTSAFASSGTAYIIDNSTSIQQQAVFTYTGKTSTTFTGCSVTSLIGSLTFKKSSAIGAPDAESHFPAITKLDDTPIAPLLVSYQQHGGHGVLQGKLTSKKSLDGGMTWGSEVDIVASPVNGATYGIFGHTICRMLNGRLIAIWYEHQMDYTVADSIAVFKTMMSYSDDQGATWSTPVKLDANFGYSNDDGTNGFGSMLYTGAGSNATYGDLYVPVVGNSDGIQVHGGAPYYRWFSKLYKITDGGAGGTWTSVSTIATTAQTGGYANGEADIVIAENGTWVAHLRVEDGAYSRWQATSTDQGVTWSGHAKVIDYLGNAGVLTKLPGGTLVSTGAYYTGAHPGETASFVSPDNGTTWPANVKREAYDATYSVYNGADADVVIDDPAVLVNTAFTYAQERSNQAGGRTMFRWYVDPVKRGADTLQFTDTAATRLTAQSKAGADTLQFTDTAAPHLLAQSRTTTDTLAFTDTASFSYTFTAAAADTLTLTDSATAQRVFPRDIADTLTWTDASTRTTSTGKTGADTLAWADAATRTTYRLGNGTDALTFTDTGSATVDTNPAITIHPQGMVPGTAIAAYLRWEWRGPVAAKLNAGPGAAVQETTVGSDLTATFTLDPGEYVAYAPTYPTKRLFFMVTE